MPIDMPEKFEEKKRIVGSGKGWKSKHPHPTCETPG
jgi:hypothetical protein